MDIARATDRVTEAEKIIRDGNERLDRIRSFTRSLSARPRVFCMEWVDPVYCSGHWVPELVDIAGGIDSLSRKGTDSVRIAWDEVLRWDPEVLVILPCGFKLKHAVEQANQLFHRPEWKNLSAVKSNRVFAVDANSYFARPGPRVIDGAELLAHLFHPDLFDWRGPADAFAKVPV